MFIDIHVHTMLYEPPLRTNGQPAYTTPADLIKRYDKLGIERAVILPGANPECSYRVQSNEEVLEIAKQYEGRFIPFCNIDPRAVSNSPTAPLDHLLRQYKQKGSKGVGEICANLPFLDPMVQNLFHHAESVGLPVTFHIAPYVGGYYGLYDDPGLPQLEQSLARFPELKFFGHSQAFWAEIGKLEKPADRCGYPKYPVEEGVLPKLMRQYPNLYGDLSAGSGCNALARDEAYAIKFLNEFQNRLLFGTDICAPGTPTPLVNFLLKLREEKKIPESVFQKVARENAIRVLNLTE